MQGLGSSMYYPPIRSRSNSLWGQQRNQENGKRGDGEDHLQLKQPKEKSFNEPERKTATASMSPGIKITPSLQLAACVARSHGTADSPSGARILADRVNSVGIVKSSNTFGLPRRRAICRFGSRHSYRRGLVLDVLLGNHL